MAEWTEFDASKLFPQELADLLSVTDPLVSVLSSALDIMADVVDVAALFVQGFTDPQAAAIAAVQDAINAVVQQLTQTGVYYCLHMAPSYSGKLYPIQWVTQIARSLDDFSDENRPILVDENAYVGAVAVAVTASTYQGLFQDYRAMFDMFGKRVATATQISRWKNRNDPWTIQAGVGQAPDWNSKKLGDIVPPVGELAKKFLAFSDSVSSAIGGSQIYDAFADQLRSKAALLSSFADDVNSILTSIEALLQLEGAYVLPIYGQGDASWVQSILLNSTGGPLDDSQAQYTAGVVFLTTGGTTDQVDLLFDLFGLPKEVSSL